jgi:hypothetical protein
MYNSSVTGLVLEECSTRSAGLYSCFDEIMWCKAGKGDL